MDDRNPSLQRPEIAEEAPSEFVGGEEMERASAVSRQGEAQNSESGPSSGTSSERLTKASGDGRDGNAPSHVVGIGASAGGLEALEDFFSAMPAQSDAAFVVVQHLSPDFKSLMNELLARHTEMPIYRAEDGVVVRANAIYLIPPKKNLVINRGQLFLSDKDSSEHLNLPIDIFFRALAADYREQAVGIVLSGTGSDGSAGIRAIHEVGGLVMVQHEDSAKFDGMPRSAIATGAADFVLAPSAMPDELMKHFHHSRSSHESERVEFDSADQQTMAEIYSVLRSTYDIDFAHYKPGTISRRLERRMVINHLESLEEYLHLVQSDRSELEALYKDFLIGVTHFFRDPGAFSVLRESVIPQLFSSRGPVDEVRIWIPGCATGEEAYSLGMLISEYAKDNGRALDQIKVFATDVHKESLEFASAGRYTPSSMADVPPDLLEQYFTLQGDIYQVSQDLRRMVVFAPHNLLKDPPFTKMDLISCRNLLIYFRPIAQRKILSMFHFSLQTGGLLFLGPSENVGNLEDEFEPLDRKWKVFRKRRDVRLPVNYRLPLGTGAGTLPAVTRSPRGQAAQPQHDITVQRAYDALLAKYVPPSLLLNDRSEVVHVFGDAGRFLRPTSGPMTLNVFSMVRDELKTAISAAMHRAAKDNAAHTYRAIRVSGDDQEEPALVDLVVQPIHDRRLESTLFLVSVQRTSKPPLPAVTERHFDPSEESQQQIVDLEYELNYTKEHLQATIEELETSNEELQSTNEELLASNEELQSTNEELHSVNEELYTVNAEYQRKIDELTQLNNDMDNLLRSSNIGTIFLDRGLRIRKYTPAAAETFNLLEHDTGRPITHLTPNVRYDNLLQDIRCVLDTGRQLEHEAESRQGVSLLVRILPYRTETGAVEGVLLTFVDVTPLKRIQNELTVSEERFRELADNIDSVFWMMSADGRNMLYVSPAYERVWLQRSDTLYRNPMAWTDAIHPDDRQSVVESFAQAPPESSWAREYRIVRPNGEIRWISDRKFPVLDRNGQVYRFAGIAEDVTQRREAEARLRLLERAVQQSVESIVVTDSEGRITFANDGCLQLHGWDRESLLGQPVCVLHSTHHDQVSELCPLLAQSREVGALEAEVAHVRSDGSTFPAWKTVSILTRDDGQLDGYVVIARDVSEHREAEEALRESERRYRSLVEAAGSVIVSLSQDGTLLEWNPEAERTYGWSRDEAIGRNYGELFPADDAGQNAAEQMFAMLREAPVRGREHSIYRRDGNVRTLLWNVYPLATEGDDSDALLAHGQDITERIAAERQLQLTQHAVDHAMDGVLWLSPECSILYANETACQWLGYTIEEMISLDFNDLAKELANTEHYDCWSQLASLDRTCLETTFLKSWGETFAVEISARRLSFDDQEYLCVFFRDISQRKAVEDALRASEEQLRGTFEQAAVGIALFDLDGRFTEVNQKLCDITGLASRELTEQTLFDLTHPNDVSNERCQLDRLLGGDLESYTTEKRLVGRGGNRFWVKTTVSLIRGPDRSPESFIMVVEDVSKRRQAEVALEQSENRYHALVESLPQSVCYKDTDLVYVACNARFADDLGLEPSEVVGRTDYDLLPRDSADTVTGEDRRVLESGNMSISDHCVERDGEQAWLRAVRAPLSDESGKPIGLLGISWDITDQKQAEMKLAATSAALAQSNRELENFAYVASHDLQEPLRTMSAFCRLLEKKYDGQFDEDGQRYLTHVIEGSERMKALIDGLLAFSRVTRKGKSFVPTDMNAVVDVVRNNLQVAIGECEAVVTNDALPVVSADETQMVQLLQNLVSNAIKFRRGKKPEVHIGVSEDDDEWTFSVRDNGIGFEQEYGDKIFGIFQRLHTRDEYPGTGIGLSLCKRIVDRQGGTIWGLGDPGNGSTFYFTVPKHRESQE